MKNINFCDKTFKIVYLIDSHADIIKQPAT